MAISRSEPQPKLKPINRQIFCVRHVDDRLISRTPSSDPGFQNTNHSMTTTPNFPKIRSVKLPLCRSTSHMDTVSSLLRRKSRISQSFYLWEPENEKKYGWELPEQYQTIEKLIKNIYFSVPACKPELRSWPAESEHRRRRRQPDRYRWG